MAAKEISGGQLGSGFRRLGRLWTIQTPVIVLALAAFLVTLPLSYDWVLSFFGPIVLYTIWKSFTTIALVNVGLAAASLALWPVVKITEKLCARWPDTMRAIGIAALLILGSLVIGFAVTEEPIRCGPAGPKSPCD